MRTGQRRAELAQLGDTVTVHAGKGAKPGRHDVQARVAEDFDPALQLRDEAGRVSVRYDLPTAVEGGPAG